MCRSLIGQMSSQGGLQMKQEPPNYSSRAATYFCKLNFVGTQRACLLRYVLSLAAFVTQQLS